MKKKEMEYEWMKQIDREIVEKRKVLSKCVAEISRLKNNGRMTRKTKRNREQFTQLIGNISVYNLTALSCKLKAEIRRKGKIRKKKLRNQKARDLNDAFQNSQSQVFNKFREIIAQDDECDQPSYREIEKERKFFENSDEVINFWKSLWCKEDQGNPNAEWLIEYQELFEKLIPVPHAGDITLETSDIANRMKKKRNWSSPGPDLIVNFWWKRLTSIHDMVKVFFLEIINNTSNMEKWFCRGRSSLLEKLGGWAYDNTRPITCTNNLYKWYTSVLQFILNNHKKKNSIMQIDQRGAKEKCSGTLENLLIDDMVLKDAHDNKRNLSCCWIDVKKAYDSLSHSWLIRMLEIHRLPVKFIKAVEEIVKNWNTVLIVPLKDKDYQSDPINITNGLFQGDVFSGDAFTLSLNPVSWELRRCSGYTLSKPISVKITHSFFMDDLKSYNKSVKEMIKMLSDIKKKMMDSGMEWNAKKCNVIIIVKGKLDTTTEEIVLEDGTKIKCLKSEDLYKFLGVPENVMHDVDDIVATLKKTVRQRSCVIWTSPLSDYNRVVSTNIFVHSSLEYFMWSEKFNLSDIRQMDQAIRNILNDVSAKYKLQMNASLYIPRNQGGRGLKNLETTYKKTKVVAAMNLLTRTDPRSECVRMFEKNRMKNGRSNIFTDAVKYAKEDFDVTLELLENSFVVHYVKDGEEVTTTNKEIVKSVLKTNSIHRLVEELTNSAWQGAIYKLRSNDADVNLKRCYDWLTSWKSAPSSVINDFQSILLQTVPTLTFQKYRGGGNITTTTCRLCKSGNETVKHLLSNCEVFAKTIFKRRHDRVLQHIMFKFLHKQNLIEKLPPWYTEINIKPQYQNENLEVFWDIPEYTGYEQSDDSKPLRPDGKIIDKASKRIHVLEMSIPWIENRQGKLNEKVDKYKNIIQTLKVDNPGFLVTQSTFIVDCLGGYSGDLVDNLKLLGLTRKEINDILPGIHKIVVSEANALINRFKVLTLK